MPEMFLRNICFGLLGWVVACADSPPPVARAEPPVSQAQRPFTCDEQVLQVQPIPVGEARRNFISACLLEREFFTFLRDRQSCSLDADCAMVETQCPFGMAVPVAKAYRAEVVAKYEAVVREYVTFSSCKYKGSLPEGTQCAAGRCALVERKARHGAGSE